MFFLIKMIFKLATLAVIALVIYAGYAILTGKNVDFNDLVMNEEKIEGIA